MVAKKLILRLILILFFSFHFFSIPLSAAKNNSSVIQLQNTYIENKKKYYESLIVAKNQFSERKKSIVDEEGIWYVLPNTILEINPNEWLPQASILVDAKKYLGKYYRLVRNSFSFTLQNQKATNTYQVVVDDAPPKIVFQILGKHYWKYPAVSSQKNFRPTVFIKKNVEKNFFIHDLGVGLESFNVMLNNKKINLNLDYLDSNLMFNDTTNRLIITAVDKLRQSVSMQCDVVLYNQTPLVVLLIDKKKIINTKRQTHFWTGKQIILSLYKVVDKVPVEIYYCLEDLKVNYQSNNARKRKFTPWKKSLTIRRNQHLFYYAIDEVGNTSALYSLVLQKKSIGRQLNSKLIKAY